MKKIMIYLSIVLFGLAMLAANTATAQRYKEMMDEPDKHTFYEIHAEAMKHFETADKGKGSGYKQYMRWAEITEPRVYPSGKLINFTKRTFDEHHRYMAEHSASTAKLNAVSGSWSNMGPTSVSKLEGGYSEGLGRVNCVAMNNNASSYYVGTPAGGLWYTANNGATWTSKLDGLSNTGVSSIVVDHSFPTTLYILTGDGDGGHTQSIGVLKSTNLGSTWQTTGLTFAANANVRGFKLIMHPTNRNILLCGTTNGLFKTTNGGTTWANTLTSGTVHDIEFKPGDPTKVYIANGSAIRFSNNTGDTWPTLFNIGASGTAPAANRLAIGVTPANANYIYVLAGPGYSSSAGVFNYRGLYRSTNGGANWFRRDNAPNILSGSATGNVATHQSGYDLCIAVNPTNAEEVYIGGVNMWKSTNGGSSFSIATNGNSDITTTPYSHWDHHELLFYGTKLFNGNDGGIYTSTDNGASFVDRSAGLDISQFYRIAVYGPDPDLMTGGMQDNGSVKWQPGNHIQQMFGADGMDCEIDPHHPDTLYMTTQNGGLRRSYDGGNTSTSIRPPFPNASAANSDWIAPYELDPQNPNIIYAGFRDLYKSTNRGTTWTALNQVVGTTRRWRHIAVSPSAPNTIYAVSLSIFGNVFSDAIIRSTNGGNSWTNITAGLPVNTARLSDVAIWPGDGNQIAVSFSGFVNGTKVFQSVNGGASWIPFSGGMPNIPVNCLAFAPGSSSGDNWQLYAGTDAGVYYSDAYASFVPYNTGLPTVIVRDLEIQEGTDMLRAGTFGRGIWQSPLAKNCPQTYNLPSSTYAFEANPHDTQFYGAANSVTSVQVINGNYKNFRYSAGNNITLLPGFKAMAGTTLRAHIASCNALPPAPPPSGIFTGPMAGTTTPIDDINEVFADDQNGLNVYPNPFKDRAFIEFNLKEAAPVSIEISNVTGAIVARPITDREYPQGTFKTVFEAHNLPAGFYFCTLRSGDYVETQKILLSGN